MSEARFEHFLITQLIEYLEKRIAPGVRYQFRARNSADASRLFREFQQRTDGDIDLEGVRFRCIMINGTKLICVLQAEIAEKNIGGFNENYISMLRDKVANQNEPMEGCALLILHNSLLDTLLSSTDNLAAPSAIWSTGKVNERLKSYIASQEKIPKVMLSLLDWLEGAIQEEGGSMFGFEPLHKAMRENGQIDLQGLNLFQDQDIIEMRSERQIERRLKDNRELREEIETIVHHFPEELTERLPDFSEQFIKKYFVGDNEGKWKDLDYRDIRREIEAHKEQILEFGAAESEHCRLIGPRPKSDSAAGRREKHLIILPMAEEGSFDLTLVFYSNDLELNEVVLRHNDELENLNPLDIKRTKGRRRISIKAPFDGTPTYFTLHLNRSRSTERLTFKVVVLREGDFHIGGFENVFLVNPKEKSLTLQTDEHELLINPDLSTPHHLRENGQVLRTTEVGVVNFDTFYDESDIVKFTVDNGRTQLSFNIEGETSQQSLSLPLLLDVSRFSSLFSDSYNGRFMQAKGKVILDNKETQVVALRHKLLEQEKLFVQDNLLYLGEESLSALRLREFTPRLYQAWDKFIEYLKRRETLPSLASWGKEFVAYVRELVNAYHAYLSAIPIGKNLRDEDRLVLKLGFSEFDGREFFTPFHPLVLSYYLSLVEKIQADDETRSFGQLPQVTRRRLNPRGLIPFVYSAEHDFGYTQVVDENPFWLEIVPQQATSYRFVSKLVHEKIVEFTRTFAELFEHVEEAPLILNSVNNGDNREVFLGILGYFQEFLGQSQSIHVNLYDPTLGETEFDQFAEMGAYDKIKEAYGLNSGKSRDKADTIIDLLRTQLSFSKFRHEETATQAYAHLTFFKNNEKIQRAAVDIDDHISGIACDGLINGESSDREQGSFYTAFGLRNVDTEGKKHLELARLVGTLLQPARKPNETYHKYSATRLAVNESFKELLDLSYASSLWTTIIDPKVTLEFFRHTRDLILIHYSDQYTSSSSYDAITVTRQTDLYRKVLGAGNDNLIGEFNAFNGEWLLKMVTAGDRIKLERRGIIAAWKFVSCLLSRSDICWIPLSVAEMVRVSGNIGLKMDDSDFSRSHKSPQFKGEMSDDILFAGFRDGCLYLLPVEVKTGSSDFVKARRQVQALRKYLVDGLLGPLTLEARIYRSLFVRQVFMQLEKYDLYDVFDKDYYEQLSSKREEWLSGEYEIADLNDYAGGVVLAHLDSEACFEVSCSEQEEILTIEVPIGFLNTLVKEDRRTLVQRIAGKERFLNIDERFFLGQSPQKNPDPTERDEEHEEDLSKTATTDNAVVQDEVHKHLSGESNIKAQKTESLRIKFGSDTSTSQSVEWEPTNTAKVLNPNTAIIGTMGTGKTQFTKSLVTQLAQNQEANVDGQPIGILILDYKADYVKPDFVEATGATVFQLHRLPFNPFALAGDRPMLPMHTANLFRTTLSTAFNLGAKQQNRIRSLIIDAYADAGILPNDQSTWQKTPPTLQNVWDLFTAEDKVEQDSLYAALDDLSSFEIFEPDPTKTKSLYELVSGVTVINLSGYDQQIQNLVVAIILDIFFAQMHQRGSSQTDGNHRQLTKFILVDEADNFMSQEFSSLKLVMKEGREFGVGTILSTQEITHFKTGQDDYSAYILTWIVHRVANIKSQDLKAIFNVRSKQEEEGLMRQIRELDKHYSLYVDGEKHVSKVRDLAFWELMQGEGEA